jgi:hypothetical protein
MYTNDEAFDVLAVLVKMQDEEIKRLRQEIKLLKEHLEVYEDYIQGVER